MSAELLHQVTVYERAKNGLHNPCSQGKRFVVRRTRGVRALVWRAMGTRAVAGRATATTGHRWPSCNAVTIAILPGHRLPARILAAIELFWAEKVATVGGRRYPATVRRDGLASFSSRGSGAFQIYCSRQFEFDPIAFTSSSTSDEVFCNLSSIVRCPHGCRQRL